ncbi:Afg1l [Scenedesmus sp. PABB004]|nr:Afg1l [Scenedesmus sp. PABB004]
MAPKALPAPNPGSRSSWQWEKLKDDIFDEYSHPAKFEANCKVLRAFAVFAAGIIIARNFGEALMPPGPRTHVRNGPLAACFLFGIAAIGLGPVAYMFLSPTSRVDANKTLPAHTSMRGAFDGISGLIKAQAGLHGAAAAAGPGGGGVRRAPARGLYMYGGVGCGKTMLMDLLVAAAPKEFQVTRTHFHDFMLDIHARLARTRGEADPLRRVADDVAAGVKVLALDELFVTDVADAAILHRLFGRLWDDGLVLVATSNRAPDSLYEGGLQRPLFLPFIARLKEACVVHDMASPVDYRRLAHHAAGMYFLTPDRTARLHAAFLACGEQGGAGAGRGGAAAGAPPALGNPGPVDLDVAMGRTLHVPQALGPAAMFDFAELCDRPLAAADYIALAGAFSTLALSDVPRFVGANRAAAYRFVTLIDVLYEHRVRLLLSAEGTPFELFERIETQAGAAAARRAGARLPGASGASSSGEVVVDDQLGFAKDRAISRLTEMQSLEYLIAHAKAHDPGAVLALQEQADKQRGAAAAAAPR